MKKHYLSLQPLLLWQEVKHPIDWSQFFGREGSLEVEIGFGNGEFLVRQAEAHPERNFIGIELMWGSTRRALRKINKAGLENVRLVQGDTRIAVTRLFSSESIERVYSLFPMPWPKEKHVKHRIFSRPFLEVLNNRLVRGGEVKIVTDHEAFKNWVVEQVPTEEFSLEVERISPSLNTKYERKWSDKGQKEFFEIQLSKQGHLTLPFPEDIPLKTYCVKHFDPDLFKPSNERGEIVVAFKEFMYDPKRLKGMVRVFVVEDDVTQNFWIEIDSGKEGWYIHVARGCQALPTVGVQRALELVYAAAGDG
jgi:tRNA (guanine-N7-)-methyltransferase